MSLDAATSVFRGMIATLRASAAVKPALTGLGADVEVFEIAPARVAGEDGAAGYTVIEIPTVQENEQEIISIDTVDDDDDEIVCVDDPREILIDVHVWSRKDSDGKGGGPMVRKIMGAVRVALATEIELPAECGFRVVLGERTTARHFTESDGLTAHGIGSFRYLVEPED